MRMRLKASAQLIFLIVLGLLIATQARVASALFVTPGNDTGSLWMVFCNDGSVIHMSGSLGTVLGLAPELCSNHGGVANITDAGVESAVQAIQTCDASSTVTVGRDLGGSYEVLTSTELEALVAQSQGAPTALQGYELLSLVVGGVELHPDPVLNLTGINITHVFSDQFDTGQYVGGRTAHPSCDASIPVGPLAGPLLALLLAGLGAAAFARHRTFSHGV